VAGLVVNEHMDDLPLYLVGYVSLLTRLTPSKRLIMLASALLEALLTSVEVALAVMPRLISALVILEATAIFAVHLAMKVLWMLLVEPTTTV